MNNRTHRGIFILTLAAGLTGCDGSALRVPTAPSTTTSTPTVTTTAAGPRPWPSGTLLEITLSGTVYEMTPTGRVPIEGVTLYCELCGADTHTWAYTDSTGVYRFTGVWVDGRPTSVHIGKDGYSRSGWSATTNAAEPVRCWLEGGHGERQYAFRRRARETVKVDALFFLPLDQDDVAILANAVEDDVCSVRSDVETAQASFVAETGELAPLAADEIEQPEISRFWPGR